MPRSAVRFCGITPLAGKPAARVTTRTARSTTGCWWPSCRCFVSGATSALDIRRPSTTPRLWLTAATDSSSGAASTVTSRFMGRIIPLGCSSSGRPTMRATTIVLCSALLAAPVAARAQESTSAAPSTGAVDVGAQFTSVSGDEARYQHYRDLRSGVLVDGFHLSKAKNDWTFKATAAHVGYRDQKYTGEVDRAGKLVITFTWDQ